jgi:hypothetical protein
MPLKVGNRSEATVAGLLALTLSDRPTPVRRLALQGFRNRTFAVRSLSDHHVGRWDGLGSTYGDWRLAAYTRTQRRQDRGRGN